MRAALLTSLVALSLGLSSLGVGCVSQKQQERAAARVELGSALLGEGNAPGAIGALEESVDLDPRNWEAWNKLGLAYAARGAPDKAMKALKKAARLAPKNAEALNNYGWLLIARGEYAEAIPVLEDHIGEHDGKAARGKLPVACRDAGAMGDGKALVLERGDDHRRDCGIILDKQDRIGRWCRHGVSSDRAPAGGAGGSW